MRKPTPATCDTLIVRRSSTMSNGITPVAANFCGKIEAPPMRARRLRMKPPRKSTMLTWYFLTMAQPQRISTAMPIQGKTGFIWILLLQFEGSLAGDDALEARTIIVRRRRAKRTCSDRVRRALTKGRPGNGRFHADPLRAKQSSRQHPEVTRNALAHPPFLPPFLRSALPGRPAELPWASDRENMARRRQVHLHPLRLLPRPQFTDAEGFRFKLSACLRTALMIAGFASRRDPARLEEP